jgi:hypothetical protein
MGVKAAVIIQQIVRVQSIFAQSQISRQLFDIERRIGALQRIGGVSGRTLIFSRSADVRTKGFSECYGI